GFKKIMLVNGHGGNEFLLPTFANMQMERPRGYQIYLVRLDGWFVPKNDRKWEKMKETPRDWHAGETETSMSLGLFPELVRMDKIDKPYKPNGRLGHLPSVMVPYWWTALVPGQYAGDARYATIEKGKYLAEYEVSALTSTIRAVKKDKEVEKVAAEFFAACYANGVHDAPRKKKVSLLR
ncbi:MAG: creatininase family protein, partial [Kiritimatiellae bacterium]|nr:creatininase family protein [Kiritimatiellia bacterium]